MALESMPPPPASCVVTGAGSGIGRALAELLARNGAKVFGVDEAASALETVKHENITTVVADVGTADGVSKIKKVVGDEAVKLLALTGDSMKSRPLLNMERADYDAMVGCNASGPIFVTQALVDNLKKAGGARILLSCGAGIDTHIATLGAYSSTKAAMKTIWLALRDECADFASVALAMPGLVKSPMWDEYLKDPKWELSPLFGHRLAGGDCHAVEEAAEWMASLCDPLKVDAIAFKAREWSLDNPMDSLGVDVTETAEMKSWPSKTKATPQISVGDLIEAKFDGKGERYFEAKILEVGNSTVKVKWTYDDDVPDSDITMESIKTNLPSSPERLIIVGEPQIRTEVLQKLKLIAGEAQKGSLDTTSSKLIRLRECDPSCELVLRRIRNAVAGAGMENDVMGVSLERAGDAQAVTITARDVSEIVKSKGRLVGNMPEQYRADKSLVKEQVAKDLGWTILPLVNDGELKGKVVGKGGVMRTKVCKVSGSQIEYLDNAAYIYGTRREQVHTCVLLDLIQNSTNGQIDVVPPEVEDICSRVLIPEDSVKAVIGEKRIVMNQLEEETGTLSIFAPTAVPEEKDMDTELELEEGMLVEGKFESPKGDRWFEAKILEVKKGENGDASIKVQWTYDEDEISEVPKSFLRKIQGKKQESKTLVIFGTERARKLAELRVMASVESVCPGTFSSSGLTSEHEGFHTEAMQLSSAEASRCKEARIQTVASATKCIIVLVGDTLYFSGNGTERACGREYMRWLSMEKPSVRDVDLRVDVSQILIPTEKLANVADSTRAKVERETKTFSFFDDGAGVDGTEGTSRLLVFGVDDTLRAEAVTRFAELQDVVVKVRGSDFLDDFAKGKDDPAGDDVADGKGPAKRSWTMPEYPGTSKPESRDEPEEKKARTEAKVEFVIEDEEEDRRKRRAARFN